MIIACIGRPGMGKSVWAVTEIEKWLARGYLVKSNINIDTKLIKRNKEKFEYISGDDLIVRLTSMRVPEKEKGIKLVVDEIQVFLNSREWAKLPKGVQTFLQQHRKRGIDMIGITQSIKRADPVFRELVQVFYEIRKIWIIKLFPIGIFWLREFDPDSIESDTRAYDQMGWGWPLIVDQRTFRLYDTTQEQAINILCKTHEEEARLKQKCEVCGISF